jgi:hypothetical protein
MVAMCLTDTFASLEHHEQPRTVDEGLLRWAQVVERLPEDAQQRWFACESRTMNVGIQASGRPHEVLFPVSLDAMAALLRIKAERVFTIYAVD